MADAVPLPDVASVVRAVRSVVGHDGETVPLHEPLLAPNAWTYLKECVDENCVSAVGRFVATFARDLADYVGIEHAVPTVNGTAALHLCLLLAGTQPDEEVVVPALTFVATANAVAYCSAVPHFADVEERTLGLDAARLEGYLEDIGERRGGACVNRRTGRRIRAVVPMHTFGYPVDLDPLVALCERFGLTLIEDAANALGSLYRGRHVGTVGRMASLSFNGNKIITTGGGGAVLTHDDSLAALARHLSTTAKAPHPWAFFHDRTGYNYRMPEINAALGCAQLEQLDDLVARKRRLAERYRRAFADLPGVTFFSEPEFARSNHWLCALLVEGEGGEGRDAVLAATHEAGIGTRPVWDLMHHLPMYAGCPRMDLPVAESLATRLVSLPSSAGLVEGVEA